MTVTGIWNQLANLLLPVIAVMLLGIEGGRDAFLTTVAVVGAAVFTVAVGALAIVLWADSFARAVGELAERVVSRLFAVIRRGPVIGWADGFVRFRRETVDLIRRRWHWLTLAAIAGNITVFAVLLVSLRAVGVESSEVTVGRGVRGLVARACAPADPAHARRCRAGRARPHGDSGRIRRGERGGGRGGPALSDLHDRPDAAARARDDRRLALARPASCEGRSRSDDGESARRVKEQSHKAEMSAALRGDFQRLRARGVDGGARADARRRSLSRGRTRSRSRRSRRPSSSRRPTSRRDPIPESPPDAPGDERPALRGWLSRLGGR